MMPFTRRWGLVLALAWCGAPRLANAQGPTIDSGPASSPGASTSLLGQSPGSGGGALSNPPGSGGAVLGGRPGTSTPRVYTGASTPGSTLEPTEQQRGI